MSNPDQAPASSQPSGPDPSPQPGATPPYPAPPYPAQPYPAQPYPAQPYPGAPYSAPPYSAPPLSAPPYGAPYAPPMYPGYAYPPVPPPPPRRSYVGWMVAGVVVLLLVGAGITGALLFVARDRVAAVAVGPSDTASPTASASASPTSQFAQPDVIGPFSRALDQSAANSMMQALPRAIQNAFVVMYDDPSNANRKLLLAGGNIAITSVSTQMDNAFAGAAALTPGAKASNRRTVSSGSAGGLSQCETISTASGDLNMCLWFGNNAYIEMVFIGVDSASAGQLVPTVLTAVVI